MSKDQPLKRQKSRESQSELAVEMLLSDAKRPLTTFEVARIFHEIGCPDSPTRLLSKLRLEGKIFGKLSIKKKTWLWWVPGVPEPIDD
ncbi:MAG: hypothetical protein ACFFDP_08380 [Promethearchaeota archaeon]